MSERDQTPHAAAAAQNGRAASSDDSWREQTTPGITPVRQEGSSGYGSSAVGPGGHGYAGPGEGHQTAPRYSTQPVAVRRGDAFAALLLILAGIAAGVSLLLPWLPGDGARGWDLLQRGIDTWQDGVGGVFSSGFWQPLAILFGGGVLFVLGLLLLVPARAHRALGLLALLVALVVTAAVLVPLADADWRLEVFRVGFFFAIAVAGLGLLGSLKALLTGPKHGTKRPA
jgi:hypothetical protein